MRSGFAEWMRKVDAAIEAKVGVSSSDLPDAPYDVWFSCGLTPSAAARKALKWAGSF